MRYRYTDFEKVGKGRWIYKPGLRPSRRISTVGRTRGYSFSLYQFTDRNRGTDGGRVIPAWQIGALLMSVAVILATWGRKLKGWVGRRKQVREAEAKAPGFPYEGAWVKTPDPGNPGGHAIGRLLKCGWWVDPFERDKVAFWWRLAPCLFVGPDGKEAGQAEDVTLFKPPEGVDIRFRMEQYLDALPEKASGEDLARYMDLHEIDISEVEELV